GCLVARVIPGSGTPAASGKRGPCAICHRPLTDPEDYHRGPTGEEIHMSCYDRMWEGMAGYRPPPALSNEDSEGGEAVGSDAAARRARELSSTVSPGPPLSNEDEARAEMAERVREAQVDAPWDWRFYYEQDVAALLADVETL